MESLNIKYRPKEFNEVSSQTSLIKILNRQLETNTFKNCYLFIGPSGTGKTTIARIFSNKINKGQGSLIEIDGASNNGVENIRLIADSAQERSLDSEYKIFIIDECHMITTAGWNAFLKTIEEPPKYTIFIFCTTDPQKIPQTILNRCQIYNLHRISDDLIYKRVYDISIKEQYKPTQEGIDYIVKLSNGSMRQAVSYLDKCKDYDINITLENVINCLGNCSYDIMFKLTYYVSHNEKEKLLNLIEDVYNTTDLKVFIDSYLKFVLQLSKYKLFNSMKGVYIPSMYEEDIKFNVGEKDIHWFNNYIDKLLEIKQFIKNDNDIKTTIQIMLVRYCDEKG
jgi:DNA polymerase III subunit gamma/tau